ncbi:MAG: GIY-YIG nuclease family protein, partial [archaeon]|nr:GIY-YIG nuclease family protein [archaeon]
MIEVGEGKKFDHSQIPTNPGVYIYKNLENEIIYIGKAKSLRKRVVSYFSKNSQYPKTELLVSKIAIIDWVVVDNEIEALLLENNLIKKHSPKYNINLKDSKTFAYIKLTDDK